jgi:hypothetical protein
LPEPTLGCLLSALHTPTRGGFGDGSGRGREETGELLGQRPGPAGLGAEPKDDLLAFVRRSALAGYTTADRMAEVVRAAGADNRYPATDLGKQMALMAGLIKGGGGTGGKVTVARLAHRRLPLGARHERREDGGSRPELYRLPRRVSIGARERRQGGEQGGRRIPPDGLE